MKEAQISQIDVRKIEEKFKLPNEKQEYTVFQRATKNAAETNKNASYQDLVLSLALEMDAIQQRHEKIKEKRARIKDKRNRLNSILQVIL